MSVDTVKTEEAPHYIPTPVTYYVISKAHDGLQITRVVGKEELVRMLNEGYWGHKLVAFPQTGGFESQAGLDYGATYTEDWSGSRILILEGRQVTPRVIKEPRYEIVA